MSVEVRTFFEWNNNGTPRGERRYVPKDDYDAIVDLLKRARVFVEYDARMVADLTRIACDLAPSGEKRVATETDSEKLMTEIDAKLPPE